MGGPAAARLVAQALLPRAEREYIIGDLEELYVLRERRYGRAYAKRMYVREVLISIASRRRPWRGRPGRPRTMRRSVMWTGVFADVRLAIRSLWRAPAFVLLAVLTLAIGIGSTTAVFGMLNQLLLRPLPGVTASGEASYLRFHDRREAEASQPLGLTLADFDAVRREATLLDGVASYGLSGVTLRFGDRRPIAVSAQLVYGDFFEVLGVRPAAGRLLGAAETELSADPLAAVISERLQASLFASAADAVGRTLLVNGEPIRVLGVAGGGFTGSERGSEIDIWLPHGALVPLVGFEPERLRSSESAMHDHIVTKVRAGVSVEAATGQLSAILGRLAARGGPGGEYVGGMRPVLYPGLHTPPLWRERTYGSLRLLGGVVGVVLLIACANVAGLLLVRNVRQRARAGVRLALGASPGRIARQQIVESLLLGVLGTAAGLVAAWLIVLPFRGERLVRMPAFEGFALDGRVLLFAAILSIVTAIVFGTLPALLASRVDPGETLRAAGPRDTGRHGVLRSTLTVGQIALSLALLIGGLLLTRTVRNLYDVETGLNTDNVLALAVRVPRDLDDAAREALQRAMLASVERVDGVSAAALDLHGPHGSMMMGHVRAPGAAPEERARAAMIPVTPGWFEMLGVRPSAGRTFVPTDWRAGSAGIVLTESLARRLFGRTDVAGRRVLGGFAAAEDLEIAGVIPDIRSAFQPDMAMDAFFVTYDRAPGLPFMTLLARTSRTEAAIARNVAEAVERLLPEQAIPEATYLAERVDTIHSERRIFSRLLGFLSTFAVVLAAVGLYGVIAFSVADRRREIGIRLAVGARPARIAGLVARHAAAIVAVGIAIGILLAYALSSVLESRLFGVARTDLVSYAAAALLLAGVAACACVLPVRSAIRVDPLITLKEQ
jgi:predicted permease